MSDVTELCAEIEACCGTPSNALFKRVVAKALCCLVEASATPEFDNEVVCASTDGRLLLLTTDTSTGTVTLTELDGSPIADGATAVNCSRDIEDVELCFQDATDSTIRYTLVNYVDTNDSTVIAQVWFDSSGNVIAPPAGVVPCAEEAPCVPAGEECYDTGAAQGKAIRLVQKQSDGTFTVTFIDSLTGTVIDPSDIIIEPCGERIVTSVKHCIIP